MKCPHDSVTMGGVIKIMQQQEMFGGQPTKHGEDLVAKQLLAPRNIW
jgi:hypothetical protein